MTARIPLYALDKSIRAFVTIDLADADKVQGWRWSLTKGYAGKFRRGHRALILHRIILGIADWDGLEGDHIDRDRLNCRRSNLRVVTTAQNLQNTPGDSNASSRHRGVSWDSTRGKWLARICVHGNRMNLGRFASEDEAATAARNARMTLMTHAVD